MKEFKGKAAVITGAASGIGRGIAERCVREGMKVVLADIDEGAWESLYRTESRPFPRPESGKIAVKVINDYGDEVMKVFGV